MNPEKIHTFPVNFVYLGSNDEEDLDKQFQASCVSIPRVGEWIVPHAGSKKVRVVNIYHNFVASAEGDIYPFMQMVNVVLKE